MLILRSFLLFSVIVIASGVAAETAVSGAADVSEGTPRNPVEYEVLRAQRGQDTSRIAFFSYTDKGFIIAGVNGSIKLLLDKPIEEVWPVFSDFNRWKTGYFFRDLTGQLRVLGSMSGETVRIEVKRGEVGHYYDQTIETVIPYKLIVKREVPRNIEGVLYTGDSAFMLTEVNDKTLITIVVQHEKKATGHTVDDLLKDYRAYLLPNGKQNDYWLDDLAVELRRVVMAQTP